MSSEYSKVFGAALGNEPHFADKTKTVETIAIGNVYAAGELIRALHNRGVDTVRLSISSQGNIVLPDDSTQMVEQLQKAGPSLGGLVQAAQQNAGEYNEAPSFFRDIMGGQEYVFDARAPKAGVETVDGKYYNGTDWESVKQTVIKGDFKQLPDGVKEEALKDARRYMDAAAAKGIRIEDTQEFRWAAKLDGKAGLSDVEFASALVAVSMMGDSRGPSGPRNGKGLVFDGVIESAELGVFKAGTAPTVLDPTLRAQIGAQVLEGLYNVKGGQESQGPEGLAQALQGSPLVEGHRRS